MVEQHFCLRWNNYRTNITAEFETLREGEHFVDVTLACDGRQLKAHKVVLSACSPYFKELLQCNPCTHPIIILRDVSYSHMRSLLEFMYAGEVNVSQAHLGSFLSTAEALKIRGLAESSDERKDAISNCLSPLSALKSTLAPFGNIPFGGLGPPFLDRTLMPPLLHHHSGEPPPNPPASHHQGTCHPLTGGNSLPLSLSGSAYAPPSSLTCGEPRRMISPVKSPSINLPNEPSLAPLALTTNASTDYRLRVKSGDGERRDPLSPMSLPPNKRLRLDRKYITPASKDSFDDKAQNGGNYTNSVSGGVASNNSESTSDITPENNAVATSVVSTSVTDADDSRNVTPKTEPTDLAASDTEGSILWNENEGNSGRGVGDNPGTNDVFSSPTHPPSSQSSALTGTSIDPENTSHLLHVLSTEHNPGTSFSENEKSKTDQGENSHSDTPRKEIPLESSSDAPRKDASERATNSPPLPPSSLPHSCQLCGKLISCRRNLWKHMERVHFTNPAVRCSICSKMFKNKYALKDHQRIYHGGMSDPSQIANPTHHSQHSVSFLSRILQDSRHHQQQHPQEPLALTPAHLPPPPLPGTHSHIRLPYGRRVSEEKEPPTGIGVYSSMGLPPMLPHPMAQSLNSPHTRPNSDWPPQEAPYSLVNVNHRSLLSELHHMVSKTD